MTESRNDGITDRLKTVYPPKTSFCGGYKNVAVYNCNQFQHWQNRKFYSVHYIFDQDIRTEKVKFSN